MTWSAEDFRNAIDHSGIERVKWWPGWKNTWHGMGRWKGNQGRPAGLVLHHTAGASTTSKALLHPSNRCDADNGQAAFVNRHPQFNSPASQFTLRRCGQLDINAYLPCYHAGRGSFAGTDWRKHGIPANSANSYMMGIEIVSRGGRDDLTSAQWKTLVLLIKALQPLCGWRDTSTFYLPRHRDWAPGRKSDIVASNVKVQKMLAKYGGLWDGKTPAFEAVTSAELEGVANPAAYRLACRLHDLGFYKGKPQPKHKQGYPAKAVSSYNKVYSTGSGSEYTQRTHDRLFS